MCNHFQQVTLGVQRRFRWPNWECDEQQRGRCGHVVCCPGRATRRHSSAVAQDAPSLQHPKCLTMGALLRPFLLPRQSAPWAGRQKGLADPPGANIRPLLMSSGRASGFARRMEGRVTQQAGSNRMPVLACPPTLQLCLPLCSHCQWINGTWLRALRPLLCLCKCSSQVVVETLIAVLLAVAIETTVRRMVCCLCTSSGGRPRTSP